MYLRDQPNESVNAETGLSGDINESSKGDLQCIETMHSLVFPEMVNK